MTHTIIPNLVVASLAVSVEFYCRALGMKTVFLVGPNREDTDDPGKAVFGMLARDDAQLMLQTKDSLASELPVFAAGDASKPSIAVYFRGFDPDEVAPNLEPEGVLLGPLVQWYGMKEIHFQDPDGHVICAAIPVGDPPA